MPSTVQHDPAYTVMFRGLQVQCDDIAHVVEAVRAFTPLQVAEREVPVPVDAEASEPAGSPVATAVYDLFREAPVWRRPIEIVKALKRKRVPGVKYTSVYAVLRYGDFVKQEGRWNLKDAAA